MLLLLLGVLLVLVRIRIVRKRERQYMQSKRSFFQSQQNIAAAAAAFLFLLVSFILLLQEPRPGMPAIALDLCLTASLFVLVKALCSLYGGYGVLAGCIWCICILFGNYLLSFYSLNCAATFLTALTAFIAAVLRALALQRDAESHKEHSTYRRIYIWLPVAALLILCSVQYARYNNHNLNRANLYHSFFDGVLISSSDPAQTLADFQMDSGFLQDIGKSAYLSEKDYYISPNAENADAIYRHIGYGRIIRYYLKHPSYLVRLMSSALSQAGHVDASRYVTLSSGTTSAEAACRADYWDLMRRFLLDRPADFLLVSLGCIALGVILVLRRRRVPGMVLVGAALSGWLVLATALVACGTAELSANLFYYQMFLDLQLCALMALLCTGLHKTYRFIVFSALSSRRKPEALFPTEPYTVPMLSASGQASACRRALLGILRDSHRFALAASVVTLLVMTYVLFIPRIGAYNNGDFGRMMDAMGLVYTPEDYFDPAVQYEKVIERYDYLEDYDWTRIRPDRVELTQSWISAGMRVLYEMAGVPFSTATLAAIHLLVLTMCLYRILYAVHRRLGERPAVFTAVLYIIMFCGSYNLGWLNSLFGEGIAFVGLIMVLASSIHTIEQAADGKQCTALVWLALSGIYLSCAKAQYVLLAPLLGLWWLILALAASSTWKRRLAVLIPAVLLFFFMGSCALGVYRNNGSISSQDTIYSALLNGILLLLNGILLYADDPAEALDELHLDPGLVADMGKHPYLDKDEYYCAPRTEMAEELIYSKVSTTDYLIWYLHHPKAFWKLLNDTAAFSAADMPDYFLYVGETNNTPHRTVDKCNLWPRVRTFLVPHTFGQYLLVLGLVYIACLKVLLCPGRSRSSSPAASVKTVPRDNTFGAPIQKARMLYALLLMVLIALGAIQYPLPMVGNGFSDPIKQLYLFREIYDIVLLVIIVWIIYRLIPCTVSHFSRRCRGSSDQTERS